ncbi:hypothetical protein BC833DRAFT_612152 [Globomyces pollinis-pini]|nr:hypothetical protein BC833DRAFT_612152 [Globomyces pollinis-pini]
MSGNSNHRNSKRRKLRTRQFRPNYQEIPPSTIPSDSGSQSGSNPVQKKKFYYQTLSDSDDSVLSKTQVLDKTRNESESPTFHYPHLNSKSQDDDDEPSDFTVEDASIIALILTFELATDESIESHELMRYTKFTS